MTLFLLTLTAMIMVMMMVMMAMFVIMVMMMMMMAILIMVVVMFILIMVVVMFMPAIMLMAVNYMAVIMLMGMALLARTTEKTSYLMRSEIRNDVEPLLEFKCYPFYMMCLHHGEHNFLINCQRHIHLRAFHNRRPVLIADGMAQLY